jgi:hypothetical protein
MVYEDKAKQSSGTTYRPREVHFWRPPCSCGVELDTAIYASAVPQAQAKGDVHFWRPPCSCGVSLDDALD